MPQRHTDHDLATVVGLYALGEIGVREGAERLDMDPADLRDILEDAGLQSPNGPRSIDDIDEEVEVAKRIE